MKQNQDVGETYNIFSTHGANKTHDAKRQKMHETTDMELISLGIKYWSNLPLFPVEIFVDLGWSISTTFNLSKHGFFIILMLAFNIEVVAHKNWSIKEYFPSGKIFHTDVNICYNIGFKTFSDLYVI